MVSFPVIMSDVFGQDSPQGGLPDKDQPGYRVTTWMASARGKVKSSRRGSEFGAGEGFGATPPEAVNYGSDLLWGATRF